MVTIILHELTHGLGYLNSLDVNNNLGYWGFEGYPTNSTASYATIYDRFVVKDRYYPNADLLINESNGSLELKVDLTSDTIFFNGDNAWIQNGRYHLPKLYAPETWNPGSSIAHLDENTYLPGNSNSLMTPGTDYAEVIHSPGEVGLAILKDMGWTIKLVNANTDEVAGSFDQITYTKENLDKYDNINYQVDCSGIESGDYYLRLVTSVVGDAAYNLANVQNDNPGLAKRSYQNITFKGNQTPTTYDLSQNYPNPFNPTTIINYQVPQNSFVTLKVYDILGREVATLVNDQKTQGRYSVNFDASRLASGVYIYQVRANDFVSSKKMMLIK